MTNLLSGVDVEYLRTAIATRSNESAVMAEAYTANDALMCKIVHEFNV